MHNLNKKPSNTKNNSTDEVEIREKQTTISPALPSILASIHKKRDYALVMTEYRATNLNKDSNHDI